MVLTLYVCSDIPEILNMPEILTIPEIPIIIQITSSLWFRKCMTLGVKSVSPNILNIPNIPDIPDIPVFPLFLKLLPRSPTMQNLEVLASKMAELLQFQFFSKKSVF